MSNYERKHDDTRRDSDNHSNGFLLGALIGGIVGAATALFLAPKSGKELRQNINDQASSIREKSEQIRETAIVKGTDVAEVAKQKTISLSQAISQSSTELMNKVKPIKSNQVRESNEADVVMMNDGEDIQKKLEETKKAFDETETQLNHQA